MAKKPLVVLTHSFHSRAVSEDLAPHAKIRFVHSRAELENTIYEADALITRFSDTVNEKLLARAPRLKAIANFAVGIDNIDLRACAKRGVRVTNTPDVLSRACAELTLALLLSAARRIPEGEKLCRSGRFRGWSPDMLLGLELKGRTAVLVGQGRIGKETAKLFRGIGIRVEWITRQSSAAEINSLLKKAQILSIHTPLTSQTRHWLNARRISLLPRDAIVLNTTRGPTVDEKALIRALTNRRIFAAGLDVFEHEPQIPTALRRLSNVVLLPHLGSATEQAREAMARLAIFGALGILNGKHPWNEVKLQSL
jgi:glyoxylate reductase